MALTTTLALLLIFGGQSVWALAPAPGCSAGKQFTARVGGSGTLDASGSYTLDGNPPSFTWSVVSGPATPVISDTHAAQPTVTGFSQFGTYVFGLSVADGSGGVSTCEVRHGAVNVDAKDTVITGNAPVDTMLGPMIRWGGSPWPWFDDRNKYDADVQNANLDLYYSDTSSSAWQYGNAPANYYDNVAGFYALYYRSGIDTYRDAARKLADRFWTDPYRLNQGAGCTIDSHTNCWPARSASLMGMVLRALDGKPEMWAGLDEVFAYYQDVTSGYDYVHFGDIREMSYRLLVMSYCGMFDPTPAKAASCKASVAGAITNIWAPNRQPDGMWAAWFSQDTSWDTGTSATLTHGSATVTGSGTAWTPGKQCANANSSTIPCSVWFTATAAAFPATNSAGDPVAYKATFTDSTHITLDRPYEGTSGTHGWVIGDVNANFVGWVIQPFIEGVAGLAFDFASKAIAVSHPTQAALARNYNTDIATWERVYGYHAAARGMYYGVGGPGCPLGAIPEADPVCTAGFDAQSSRMDNAQVIRSLAATYARNADPAVKAFADNLYSAMWSKPGTGGPNGDSDYISGYDNGGWYASGPPPNQAAPKYFGMSFGLGNGSTWPSVRQGAAVRQGGSLPAVHGRKVTGRKIQ